MTRSVSDFTGIAERMVEEDGKLHLLRSQDVKPLIDANKIMADLAPKSFGDAKWRFAGRIPPIIAETWSKECGAGIGTQEFLAYCKRKLMDGDFAAFRIKGY
jgi:hypothetical protein